VKRHLLDYTTTAMQFSDAGVDRRLVTWNRIILLHGPPGTGKTSLCRALAHKAAIRLSDRYSNSHLLEINAHSLFSKWFSESGKLVLRLFQHVHELVEDDDAFVVLLIDEVESLTASRSASGSEPSDSLRVVNAVLTQLDGLSQHPNVLVLATSNLSGAIDGAFLDRADLKLFIGPPGLRARFEILRSCFAELVRAGIVTAPAGRLAPYIAEFAALPEPARAAAAAAAAARAASTDSAREATAAPSDDPGLSLEAALLDIAVLTEGLSARSLRKLPFNAFNGLSILTSAAHFLGGMRRAAAVELSSRVSRSGGV
jgi:SpoVK/Ycf46/Vps4 family AAA+-type ATPase